MNGASLLIMLIVSLTLAAGGAYLITQVGTDAAEGVTAEDVQANPQIMNVIGQNITNKSINHVRISVRTDRPLRLNDTEIVLRTEGDVARLGYRNGTLTRNTTEGFFTQ